MKAILAFYVEIPFYDDFYCKFLKTSAPYIIEDNKK
jgi:hypothetical protein